MAVVLVLVATVSVTTPFVALIVDAENPLLLSAQDCVYLSTFAKFITNFASSSESPFIFFATLSILLLKPFKSVTMLDKSSILPIAELKQPVVGGVL
ncbi:MAG: hypothetical protein J6C64_00685 [Lachnospiraceae bacterium]|nr:hypothetical protein [Lachnospiraceae bacterium]